MDMPKTKLQVEPNQYGLFADAQWTARLSSLNVALIFGKRHANVMRDIQALLADSSGLSAAFKQHNFTEATYKTSQNRMQPCFWLTRDGFMMLAMGYTGEKAIQLKELYINRYNEMEQLIHDLKTAKLDYPRLTTRLNELYKNDSSEKQKWCYINEANMINMLVLGMKASQFKKEHGLPDNTGSIRPYLTNLQIALIMELQMIDYGLTFSTPKYEDRKAILIREFENTKQAVLTRLNKQCLLTYNVN